jgi:hypothetical protein
MQHFNKARAAMARGEVAVDAIKALRPEKFDGVPEAQHEAIARQLQRGLPTMKDNLLNRVVNLAPADKTTKEKDLARRQFQPDKGKEPEADIFILSNAGATPLSPGGAGENPDDESSR